MAEAGSTLPEALIAKINELATNQFNRWKSSATEEQKSAGIAKLDRFRTDESFKTQEMEKMTNAWSQADGNGDGKLDLQEYKNFDAALRKIATDAGEWYDEDMTDAHYEVLN